MSSDRRREMVDLTDLVNDEEFKSGFLSIVFSSLALAGLAASVYMAGEIYDHYSISSVFNGNNGTVSHYLGSSLISSMIATGISAFTSYKLRR